jgi:hypothetical protein
MHWQTALPNVTEIDAAAAGLLDALERVRPIRDLDTGPRAIGRWLVESGQDGDIAEDTVVWLHHILLPQAA